MAVNYLTPQGFTELKAKLEDMKVNGRADAARAIAEARDKGDLSENAEYDAAKEAQGLLELRINELEKTLANSRVLDASQLDNSEVRVLSRVTIENQKNKKSLTYQLVSEAEADIRQKRISVSSPMGQGLLGKKKGELATVQTPGGEMKFKVLNIEVG